MFDKLTTRITIVEQNGLDIRYITEPEEEVQLAAVNQNGLAIQFIANPSRRVKINAFKQNPCKLSMMFVKKALSRLYYFNQSSTPKE